MGKQKASQVAVTSKQAHQYIAIDLGAESGRIIAGNLQDSKLSFQEIYRFRTQGTMINGELHWNVIRFWEEIIEGLRKFHEKIGSIAEGIGIDTWGVSIVGLDKNDHLRFTPFHYRANIVRDPMLDNMKTAIGEKFIFDITGIQFMALNTSTHMFAMNQLYPDLLKQSATIFMMPDFFYFLLTGTKITEYTNASTTQLLDAKKRQWSVELLKKLGINSNQFPPLIHPGTKIGEITQAVQDQTKLGKIPVFAVGTHDTASAIAAIPHTDINKPWAYLSSGTWSLLGVEIPEPIINEKMREYNLTNEGGIDNTIRLLKNIMGLWLIQQCKQEWDSDGKEKLEYSEIMKLAELAPSNQSLIYPDDNRFFNPKSMIKEIQDFCKETQQSIPQSKGEIARCIFESLACRYREILEMIQELTHQKVEQLHIVGGGSKNTLLCQMTANILQIDVIAGPIEATAIGNLLMQARASGLLKNLTELRTIVRNSFPIDVVTPKENCDSVYQKYKTVRSGSK